MPAPSVQVESLEQYEPKPNGSPISPQDGDGERECQPNRVEESLAKLLEGTPLLEVANTLGEYLGIGCDFLSFLLFLSNAAGRMSIPVNLSIYSDSPGSDQMIADRIANIVPDGLKQVDTIGEFRILKDLEFKGPRVVLIRNDCEALFQYACRASCQDVSKGGAAPSLWLLTDRNSKRPLVGVTLGVLASQGPRMLTGFGHSFCGPADAPPDEARENLEELLSRLMPPKNLTCAFQDRIRAEVRPEEMVIFNRVLRVFTALRIGWIHRKNEQAPSGKFQILIDDYRLSRDFLTSLPLAPLDSSASAYAIETAEVLYQATEANAGYQKEAPDHSPLGRKLFTRRDAQKITGLSYNSVKTHLSELEDAGILESTVIPVERERGKQIHFRFLEGRAPPFGLSSPYQDLPPAERIAADCTRLQ